MYFNRTSLKIAFLYCASFFIASILIFALTGIFLARTLQIKDQELLESRFHAYEGILRQEGVEGLQSSNVAKKILDSSQFYVRYSDGTGTTLFLRVPDDHEQDSEGQSVDDLEKFLSKSEKSPWIVFPGKDYGDDIEFVSGKAGEGYLQVGKDSEDREAFLLEYLRSFLTVFFSLLVLSLIFGYFLSSKILAPIRWLTATVMGIRDGKTSARVPLRGKKDELDQLGKLFNQLMDRNDVLIRSLTEALDNVAHDLRTPTMRLRSSVHQALEKKMGVEKMSEALSDALENSEIILKILNANMDITEAEAGTLRLHKEVLDLKTLLTSVLDFYTYFANENGFLIESEFQDGLRVFADPTRLMEAVSNLIDNAIKYSPEGSPVKISSCFFDGHIEISVADLGPGVNEKDLNRIWDRFYRGDQSRSSRGSGLGLSLVRAIAVAHDGSVRYEARPGGGSVFKIILQPLKDQKDEV